MNALRLPWQSILELESVARMWDGIDVWVEAGDKFACARWNHRYAWSQQTFIAKCADQSQHSVRSPRRNEQKADSDASFSDANFYRCLCSVLIRSKALDVHLLGLSFQRFLVIDDMRYDLTVVVDNHAHRNDIGECKNGAHKHVVVERVGEIVECAGCEITFGHVASPELHRWDDCPRDADRMEPIRRHMFDINHDFSLRIEPDEGHHQQCFGHRKLSVHRSRDCVVSVVGDERLNAVEENEKLCKTSKQTTCEASILITFVSPAPMPLSCGNWNANRN